MIRPNPDLQAQVFTPVKSCTQEPSAFVPKCEILRVWLLVTQIVMTA